MFLAYRAYIQERSRHRSLEFLYDVTRTVHRAPTVPAALTELLTKTRSAFHAETAEIHLFPADGSPALRTTVTFDGVTALMEPDESVVPAALRRAVEEDGSVLLRGEAAHGHRELLLAPLTGEHALLGTIALANREGRVTEFTSGDLTLLETLANHTAVSLEHDQLEQAVWALTEDRDRLQHSASHDQLTGLANRALFTQRVEAALERPDGRAVVLFLDLDDFKQVNDHFGHEIGDELLVAFTRRLRSCLRASDLPARLGGDEFAVLLDRGDHERATRIAERIQVAFKEPFKLSTATLQLGASTGIALGEHGEVSAAEVLRNADVAMYAAKEREKGRFEVFDDRQAAPLRRRHTLTGELERAVEQRSLEVSYQPIVELATGRVVGAEALARWQRPDEEDVSPAEFIPLAERSGLIVPLGELVQARAYTQLQRWERSAQTSGLVMHVNLSPAELRDPDLVPRVAGGVEDAGLDPGRLVLEVTESALLEDPRLALAQLERLRALGVRIAIDDFGTGYSSLQTLQRLPIDMLKMAQSFVDDDGLAFQTTILQLARALDVTVVAEGIESQAQLEQLRELGCDMGQGFHLSPPLSGVALLDQPLSQVGFWGEGEGDLEAA
jgi:diguanylate cyclase (GGDEF)-like protein